ncbi:MAG TPA: site-2 protease family protein [Anaeromyxobacteraceae bacterium]|nr:site-2 protease family protein [Anaeromyxobacteraceae bacterium]
MAEAAAARLRCGGCATELPGAALACPSCHRLVHAESLTRLAAEARALEAAGDGAGALAAWRQALGLLPPGARQHQAVQAAVARLAAQAPPPPADQAVPRWLRWLGPAGVVLLGAWKLVGFGKLASVLSLVAFFGVYLRELGWQYAAGFVLSIYLHELGHVAALRRAGIPAGAPMFVPGLGAFVRMQAAPKDARTDAAVGLAGPTAGLLAALACQAAWWATGLPVLRAVAHSGAVLNLFNLAPIWQLDGARGLAPLAPWQRTALLGVAGLSLVASGERMLWLVILLGGLQALSPAAPRAPDHRTFAWFAALLAGLAWLSWAASAAS